MLLIGQQVELAGGWSTAWLHERRGRGGEWVKNLGPGLTQATFPGMPGRTGDAALKHRLDGDMATGIKHETKPHPKSKNVDPGFYGLSAMTSIVTFGNGHKWIRKRAPAEDDDDLLGMDAREFQNEVLAPKVSDIIGAGAADALVRKGDDGSPELWEPYQNGAKPLVEWMGGVDDDGRPYNTGRSLLDLADTPQGVKIGILDLLIGNRDRNMGNVMVRHNSQTGGDYPVPIDHGRARFLSIQQNSDHPGPFGRFISQHPELLSDIPDEQWQDWYSQLMDLRGDFTAMGRNFDHQELIKNFGTLRSFAQGDGGAVEPAYETYD